MNWQMRFKRSGFVRPDHGVHGLGTVRLTVCGGVVVLSWAMNDRCGLKSNVVSWLARVASPERTQRVE